MGLHHIRGQRLLDHEEAEPALQKPASTYIWPSENDAEDPVIKAFLEQPMQSDPIGKMLVVVKYSKFSNKRDTGIINVAP